MTISASMPERNFDENSDIITNGGLLGIHGNQTDKEKKAYMGATEWVSLPIYAS